MKTNGGAVADWLGFLAYERGLSPRTRRAYADDIRALARHLGAPEDAWPDWAAVGTPQLLGFLEAMRREGLSESTRARRLVAVKGFFAHLRSEEKITADPAAALVQARRTRRRRAAARRRRTRGRRRPPHGRGATRCGTRRCWSCSTAVGCA